MGVFLGSNEISNVYVGGDAVDAVYLGSELVWPPGPPPPPWWPTIWEPITSNSLTGARDESRAIAASHNDDFQTVEEINYGFDFSSATRAGFTFVDWSGLKRVGIRNTGHITDMRSLFVNCSSLEEVPPLDTRAVTIVQSMFSGCTSLVEVELPDFSKVTDASAIFGLLSTGHATSLERLILPGIRVGFRLRNTNMPATALNDFFHSLGTANGSQTIDIAGAPGAAACDKSIATAKGWTITG